MSETTAGTGPVWMRHLSKDIPASLVVFLVAVPLSLGIAVASGAPIRAGLVAAVIGGILVGVLGGAPLQVSGPAAGLSVMVYGFVQKFGFEATCVIGMIAGLVQLGAGTAGIAQAALAVSPAVLHAMLAGIGILIVLGQAHVLLGHVPQGSAIANVKGLIDSVKDVHPDALMIGALTLGILIAWNRFVAKRLPALPGSLVAVVVGTLVSVPFGHLARVQVSEGMLADFTWPSLGGHGFGELVLSGLALALVASAESLLCAVATDKLHSGARANLNRELMAQGAANLLSGSVGGLPVTGVIVRSSANINAGGRTKASATLHGVWVLVFVVFATPLLRQVPLAALAGLLVHVGINLVKVKEYKEVAHFGEGWIYLATLGGVVFINLLWGIGIGLTLAVVQLLRRVSDIEVEVKPDGERVQATLRGHLTFLGVPTLTTQLGMVPPAKHVTLVLETRQIDHAAIEAIRSWKASYERGGGKVTKESLEALFQADKAAASPAPVATAA